MILKFYFKLIFNLFVYTQKKLSIKISVSETERSTLSLKGDQLLTNFIARTIQKSRDDQHKNNN